MENIFYIFEQISKVKISNIQKNSIKTGKQIIFNINKKYINIRV